MKLGKIPREVLERLVFTNLGTIRKEVVLHSQYGEDAAAIDLQENLAVVTVDPITCADAMSGYLSVYVACNDLAACGAKPIAILVAILLPPDAEQDDLSNLMKEIDRACNKLQIEVVGGHTEVTDSVRRPLICTTAIGKVEKQKFVTSSGAKPGDWIVVTKHIGLEGTSILASDFEELLRKKFSEQFIKKAQSFIEHISVVEEGLVASQIGVSAMHDITEGGLIGAIFELAKASKVGFELWEDQVPVLEETKQICEFFNINPLKLISSGSMLICTKNADKLIDALAKKRIKATIIGKILKEGYYVVSKNQVRAISEDLTDEIYEVRKRFANKAV